MKTSMFRSGERLAIYGGLAAAITLGLAGRAGMPAFAQTGAPSAPAIRLATVDILDVTEKLLATDAYTAEQRSYVESLNKPLQTLDEELKSLRNRYQLLGPESPERTTIEKDFAVKDQQLKQQTEQASAQLENFRTLQAGKAYRLVVEAAQQIGTQAGYTHIMATRSGAPTIRSENRAGALQEMLARPLVHGIADDDLTGRVLTQLNLNNPPRATPTP